MNNLNAFLIFLAVTLAGIAPAFATAPPEFQDMGEAEGYHYSAKVVAETGPEDNRLTTWEIAREKDGKTETISRFDLSDYLGYAGVFPDNQYFYLADSHLLSIYPLSNPQESVIAHDLEDTMIYQICIIDGKLYFLTEICVGDPGTLYRIDLEKRAVKEILKFGDERESYMLRTIIIPKEESVLYSSWGPGNGDTFEILLGEHYNPDQAMDLFGGFYGQYYIDWVLDLKTGDEERLLTAQASSTLLEEGKPTDYLSADKAIDGDISTAWVEGVEGPGIGESLTINLCRELEISGLALIPGYAQSQEVFWGNNRLKKARLEFSDGSSFEQSFTDQICMQDISLPDSFVGLKTRYVKITILEVYPGSRWDDTCISEVTIGIRR